MFQGRDANIKTVDPALVTICRRCAVLPVGIHPGGKAIEEHLHSRFQVLEKDLHLLPHIRESLSGLLAQLLKLAPGRILLQVLLRGERRQIVLCGETGQIVLGCQPGELLLKFLSCGELASKRLQVFRSKTHHDDES